MSLIVLLISKRQHYNECHENRPNLVTNQLRHYIRRRSLETEKSFFRKTKFCFSLLFSFFCPISSRTCDDTSHRTAVAVDAYTCLLLLKPSKERTNLFETFLHFFELLQRKEFISYEPRGKIYNSECHFHKIFRGK